MNGSMILFLALIILVLTYLGLGLIIKFYKKGKNVSKRTEKIMFIVILIIALFLLGYGVIIDTFIELMICYIFFIILCFLGIYKGILRRYEMDDEKK